MNQNDAIEVLKVEARANPAADAVFHVFALRQRARHQVTMLGLTQRMKAEGFNFEARQYEQVLKSLAKAGFGRLETDTKGKVKALRDVKITLQSLGKAICGQKQKLENFQQRNRYKSIIETANAIQTDPTSLAIRPFRVSGSVSITLSINGKPLVIPVPEGLTSQEIAGVIARLKGESK